MKIKKFYEAEEYIYGNPGIPGQSGDPNEPDYLSDAKRRRDQQIRQQGPGSFELHAAARITRGHERQLEELATRVFNHIYRGLVDRYKIVFDIKFTDQREIAGMVEINESLEEEKYKRKIINLVSQGESKNMMYVIHSQEIKDGINEIFGENKGEELLRIWDNIVKAVDAIDNNRNVHSSAGVNPTYIRGTIQGIVKVTWTKNEANDVNEANDDEEEFFEIMGIYNALKDGGTASDYFPIDKPIEQKQTASEKLKAAAVTDQAKAESVAETETKVDAEEPKSTEPAVETQPVTRQTRQRTTGAID